MLTSALRAVLSLGNFLWNIPRQLLILLLKGYRLLISPLYGQVCRYFPSCSGYALEAITIHGAVRGSYLAVRRLLRCHPWSAGGIDHVPAHRHVHQNFAGRPIEETPRIVVLNHPERYLDHLHDGDGSLNRAA
ncbi:membrane protein insertion efficiency factor YidD [Psychromicrobium sp. YIM B11713]|uniref:membrane protein insertion efficiency factor YidD n=1 Tax=Psychromicrobium sp. YIM B11713 TaxID=3145233 RepID=UPI00374EC1C2